VAERRRIALLLQLEAHPVDAARGVDREHERKVDGRRVRRLLRGGRRREDEEECERVPQLHAATRCIAAPA
jgi:hypothetical protein